MTAQELAAEASRAIEPFYRLLETVAEEVLNSRPPRAALTETHFSGVAAPAGRTARHRARPVGHGLRWPRPRSSRAANAIWRGGRHNERVARLRLNFDPTSIDVYDYLQMDWYQLAQRGQQRVAYGPYVDYSGSDMYTITATIPVIADGTFLGVAGADLVVGDVERRLIEVLRHTDEDAVVVNTERRVIAANTPRWLVGSRLDTVPTVGDTYRDVAELPLGTGWSAAPSPTS